MIAAMDKGRGIGFKNGLIYKSKIDMQRFKNLTTDGNIVMGYNTMLSLPTFPLPKRFNIVCSEIPVLSSRALFLNKECIIEYSKKNDIWIIGGAKTYNDFLPYAEEIYLTVFNDTKEADVFFPKFESEFNLIKKEEFNDKEVSGMFCIYRREK